VRQPGGGRSLPPRFVVLPSVPPLLTLSPPPAPDGADWPIGPDRIHIEPCHLPCRSLSPAPSRAPLRPARVSSSSRSSLFSDRPLKGKDRRRLLAFPTRRYRASALLSVGLTWVRSSLARPDSPAPRRLGLILARLSPLPPTDCSPLQHGRQPLPLGLGLGRCGVTLGRLDLDPRPLEPVRPASSPCAALVGHPRLPLAGAQAAAAQAVPAAEHAQAAGVVLAHALGARTSSRRRVGRPRCPALPPSLVRGPAPRRPGPVSQEQAARPPRQGPPPPAQRPVGHPRQDGADGQQGGRGPPHPQAPARGRRVEGPTVARQRAGVPRAPLQEGRPRRLLHDAAQEGRRAVVARAPQPRSRADRAGQQRHATCARAP